MMGLYNKRSMGFLEDEIEKDQRDEKGNLKKKRKLDYLVDVLDTFKKIEDSGDLEQLYMFQKDLNNALKRLGKDDYDKSGWRRDLLLNYFLNLELSFFKQVDESQTRWTIFLDKTKKNKRRTIITLANKIEEYVSSQGDQESSDKQELTQEEFDEIEKEYNEKVVPYIEKNLDLIDSHQAKTRLSQRINLLKRKLTSKGKASFGEWLKLKRTAKGLTLNALGQKSGYSPTYIYRIESGSRQNPTSQVVSKLVKALGYQPEDYLNLVLDETDESLSKIDLGDLILLSEFSIHGEEVSDEARKQLFKVYQMIIQADVLKEENIQNLHDEILELHEKIQ